MPRKKSRIRLRYPLMLLVTLIAAWCVWRAFYLGPVVVARLASDRPAIGPGTEVRAYFEAPKSGLVALRLELEQGDCRELLAEQSFERVSVFDPRPAVLTETFELKAVIGHGAPACLAEGDVTISALARRISGPLRGETWDEAVLTLPVIFRPPALQLLSSRHYLRQGGSGIVRFRVGESAVRSGVRVGAIDLPSYALPKGATDRFTLFGVPWDLSDRSQIRLYAEDAAGNRVEAPFVDHFRAVPPRRDVIRLPESFLERVVPAIASQTPGFDASGPLVEQYLRINRDLRVANRAFLAELSRKSVSELLWEGPFLQLRNSARRAGYGETRSYRYAGREVDVETHLGLDLASVAHAAIEAPNGGRVLFSGFLGIYGNAVVIDHGYGMLSVCAHLSSSEVSEGQLVVKGEVIGHTGATGLAGGDHLHLGIFLQGVAVDPMEWLDASWIRHRILPELPRASIER